MHNFSKTKINECTNEGESRGNGTNFLVRKEPRAGIATFRRDFSPRFDTPYRQGATKTLEGAIVPATTNLFPASGRQPRHPFPARITPIHPPVNHSEVFRY